MSDTRSDLDGRAGEDAAHPFAHLAGKSREVLEEEFALLIESASDEDCDLALIDAYLAALDELDPVDFGEENPAAALAKFKNKHPYYFSPEGGAHTGRRPRKRPAMALKWVAAVLVVALGGAFAAQAVGVDVWGNITRWTGSVLHFGVSRDNEVSDGGNESLQAVLDVHAIEGQFVPAVPEGYAQGEITVSAGLDFTKILVPYTSETGAFMYTIRCFQHATDAESYLFETKQDVPYDTYVVGDMTHYIIQNNETMTAMWRVGAVMGVVSGDLSEAEIRQLIDSLYTDTL